MEEQILDPIVISLARRLKVFPQYVQLALQAWDYTDAEHQQRVYGQNSNYFFFAIPWLVTARGNQLRPKDVEKNRKIFHEYEGFLRFEDQRGERSLTILNVRFDDELGKPVRGIVDEGNHRINEFNKREYRWFPITVFTNQYDDRVLDIPYSETKKHSQYGTGYPSYPDPKWTIASTTNAERVDGPVLLDIRAVYDRVKLESIDIMDDGKKKKQPKRRRMIKMQPPRDEKKSLVGFGLGAQEQQEFWIPVCSLCDNYYRTVVPCGSCTRVAYCSERCRDLHWDAGHDNVCELEN